jgi:hypothetical protein
LIKIILEGNKGKKGRNIELEQKRWRQGKYGRELYRKDSRDRREKDEKERNGKKEK